MCDFKDAKVGDRVWGARHGWGKINEIDESFLPIKVRFDSEETDSYDDTGREYRVDKYPTLFWDEVKIIPPPKPKRKVKKVIEGWVSLFLPAEGRHDGVVAGVTYGCTNIFETKESLGRHKKSLITPYTVFLGDPIFIRHEYEVEE